MRLILVFIFLVSLFIISGCVPINKQTLTILNCDNVDTVAEKNRKLPILVIKRFDILDITITDATAKQAELNPCINGFILETGGGGAVTTKEFLVDVNGLIKLNCFGDQLVVGKTILEIQSEITSKLKTYLSNPLVVVRLKNFQYAVEGEVGAPGAKIVQNTRATILEAISLSGGLKIFAQKDSVQIFRELPSGQIERGYVNLNNKNIINSPYYYLQQNDYIYVPPTKKRKINEDKTIERYIGLGTSILGVISSLLILITLRNR